MVQSDDAGSASKLDCWKMRVGRRRYYICLLYLDTLFGKGATPFTSEEPDVFNQLLLKSPSKAVAGQSVK
eukprot:6332839-Pyramimonas_sp.AAC.1